MSSLARAFALFTSASVVGSVTQVLKGKLSAVFLGADGVGVLNQLTSVWSLFSVVAGMGFYNGMVRHLAEHWGQEDREGFRAHMSSSTLFLLATSLILALVGCVFSVSISAVVFDDGGERAELICIILVSVPVFAMAQVYRAMLNATRSVSGMVKARILADTLSVVVLAALIRPFGLVGAVASYIALHALFMLFTVWFTRRAIGADVLVPDPRRFAWAEVRRNAGLGINGLIAVAVGIVTAIIVSRWIISGLGTAENGIFTMALKVATVYLGGLAAAAGGYYFPTLAAAKSDAEMHGCIDETLSLFLYFIPPIIVVLMAGGDTLMLILFSQEFVPAAALLLLALPGDLFRITAETVGLPLLVKKRLVISTGLYALWAAVYLSLAAWMLPRYGILGVAGAYLVSQALNSAIVFVTVRRVLGYRISWACLMTIARGLTMVFCAAAFLWISDDRWMGYMVCAGLLGIWFSTSLRDAGFMRIIHKLITKLH